MGHLVLWGSFYNKNFQMCAQMQFKDIFNFSKNFQKKIPQCVILVAVKSWTMSYFGEKYL